MADSLGDSGGKGNSASASESSSRKRRRRRKKLSEFRSGINGGKGTSNKNNIDSNRASERSSNSVRGSHGGNSCGSCSGSGCTTKSMSSESMRLKVVSSVISIWASFLTTRDCVNASACCRDWNKGLARFRKTKLEFIEHHPCPAEVQYLTIGKHIIDGRIRVDVKKIPPNVRWMKLGVWDKELINLSMNWPSRLETLHLRADCSVSCAELPSTLTALRWWHPPDHLVLGDLPQGLRELTLKTQFWYLSIANLPPDLVKLSLGYWDFNEPVAGMLPTTLQTLKLGGNFNRPVDSLPPRLQVCKLGGGRFDQSIDEMPDSVRELKLGEAFSRRVKKWPACLTRLHCPSQHWEAVDSAPLPLLQSLTISSLVLPPLPSSLTELAINASSGLQGVRQLRSLPPLLVSLKTREVELLVEAWPEGLTSLDFDRHGLRCAPPSWPSGLVSLKINHTENYPQLPPFPHTLLTLSIGGQIKFTPPPKLTSLSWSSYPSATEPLLALPHSLTRLDISGEVPPLPSLPPHLDALKIAGTFNEPLALPLSLYRLEITGKWNQPLCLVSKDMIKVNLISSDFNAKITGPLPRVLWLPRSFKGDLPWPLPPYVRDVRICEFHPRAKELKRLDPRVTLEAYANY